RQRRSPGWRAALGAPAFLAPYCVIPAQAGTQAGGFGASRLGPRLRGDDERRGRGVLLHSSSAISGATVRKRRRCTEGGPSRGDSTIALRRYKPISYASV